MGLVLGERTVARGKSVAGAEKRPPAPRHRHPPRPLLREEERTPAAGASEGLQPCLTSAVPGLSPPVGRGGLECTCSHDHRSAIEDKTKKWGEKNSELFNFLSLSR